MTEAQKIDKASRNARETSGALGGEAEPVRHTPGPWQMSGARQRETLYGHGVGPDGGTLIAMVPYSDFTPEEHIASLADARLIAAAPDLLEACRGFLAHRDALVNIRPDGTFGASFDAWQVEMSNRVGAIRAAISKATGGAP